MSVVWQIVYAVAIFMPCFWLALLVLSWLDARKPDEPAELPEPLEHPQHRPRPVDYFTVLPLHWLMCFLIWPGFVGNWLGRPRRGK